MIGRPRAGLLADCTAPVLKAVPVSEGRFAPENGSEVMEILDLT
jgi:hypothetical protein